MKLDLHKACGSDVICSEHLTYASNVLGPLLTLAMCFTGFISHGFLPESMLSFVLVPVIKDTTGKISSKDNYRPIALASVISKLIEVIMLDIIENNMNTHPNQVGFKRKHDTDQCIYVLKECIDFSPIVSSRTRKCSLLLLWSCFLLIRFHIGSRNKFSSVKVVTLGIFFNLHKCKMSAARYVNMCYTRTDCANTKCNTSFKGSLIQGIQI